MSMACHFWTVVLSLNRKEGIVERNFNAGTRRWEAGGDTGARSRTEAGTVRQGAEQAEVSAWQTQGRQQRALSPAEFATIKSDK